VEPDDVLEQAREKLVEIVQTMMRYMDRRSREEGQLFRGLVERQVPGMPAMIDQASDNHTRQDRSRQTATGIGG
jgi:hypothetical protein